MSETLTITLPITPPSDLFPNKARTLSFHKKARISRPLREQAGWYALESRMHHLGRTINDTVILDNPLFAGPVTVRVYVGWERGRRQPDNSALAHAVKPLEDGLTDAKIWNDDRQVVETCYRQGKDPDGAGFTRFEISPEQPS